MTKKINMGQYKVLLSEKLKSKEKSLEYLKSTIDYHFSQIHWLRSIIKVIEDVDND